MKGTSSDLVRSMFQVGRKAAELERVKLQMEIQKEKSKIRRKKLESRLKMAGKSRRLKWSGEKPEENEN